MARDHGAAGAERTGRMLGRLLGDVGQRLVVLLLGEVELGLEVLLAIVHGR